MYYVLSQVPSPLHLTTAAATSDEAKKELSKQLAYAEGCYGGIPTLQAPALWASLATLKDVNAVVKLWILTLEKNVSRCYKYFDSRILPVNLALSISDL